MKQELTILLTEAFIKDIERYELDKIGFIHDTRRETDFLLQCIPHPTTVFKDVESYRKWYTGILQTYYLKKISPVLSKILYKILHSGKWFTN